MGMESLRMGWRGAITGFICFPGKVFLRSAGSNTLFHPDSALYVYCECPYPISFVSRNFFCTFLQSDCCSGNYSCIQEKSELVPIVFSLLLFASFLPWGSSDACHGLWKCWWIVTLLHQLYAQLLKVSKLPPERGQEK